MTSLLFPVTPHCQGWTRPVSFGSPMTLQTGEDTWYSTVLRHSVLLDCFHISRGRWRPKTDCLQKPEGSPTLLEIRRGCPTGGSRSSPKAPNHRLLIKASCQSLLSKGYSPKALHQRLLFKGFSPKAPQQRLLIKGSSTNASYQRLPTEQVLLGLTLLAHNSRSSGIVFCL